MQVLLILAVVASAGLVLFALARGTAAWSLGVLGAPEALLALRRKRHTPHARVQALRDEGLAVGFPGRQVAQHGA
mgnify:CR=1 FL=1